ncbi:MAG: DUF971 domain-containing protein [Spirochaetaceae bacterium]|nr:MAG: DUF971 domain-containing protein [Spirochaetaceae bacterium]
MPTEDAIRTALAQIIDPDLNQDIISLGFLKTCDIRDGHVAIELELTTPACPVRDMFRDRAQELISSLPGVASVQVRLSSRKVERSLRAEQSGLDAVDSLIAVASGKGGVGKSTVAASLALELSREGHRVGLLDMDIFGPSIPTLFEHHEPGLEGNANNQVLPMDFGGLKVMSFGFWLGDTPAIMRGPMVTNYVQQFLHQVAWGELDYLFLDLPPGTGDVQITITQSAQIDGALIVTTPHVLSAADVGKAIRMFDKVNVPVLGVIENMSYFVAPDTGNQYRIFGEGAGQRIAERYGVPVLAQIPISATHFGGPTLRNERSSHVASAVDAAVRQLGRSRAGMMHPEILSDAHAVTLQWPDGTIDRVPNTDLRAACGCAVCVDEFTGEPKLDPSTIPPDIKANALDRVGNYAVSVEWSDGHTTGFFPYDRIRQLARRA